MLIWGQGRWERIIPWRICQEFICGYGVEIRHTYSCLRGKWIVLRLKFTPTLLKLMISSSLLILSPRKHKIMPMKSRNWKVSLTVPAWQCVVYYTVHDVRLEFLRKIFPAFELPYSWFTNNRRWKLHWQCPTDSEGKIRYWSSGYRKCTSHGITCGDKPRQIIARFYSQATRRDVMISSR